MKQRTKEEKQAYYAGLRAQWKEAKALMTAGKVAEIEAIIMTHGLNISSTGFMIVSMEMRAQGLDGLPYLDAKTYQGWKENGFQVKRGEKSTLGSITWIPVKGKKAENTKDGDNGFMMPKAYNLFHRSQVEAA